MRLSAIGERFSRPSGILRLMDDLGAAFAGDRRIIMLGGGNPSHIPAVQKLLRSRMERILATPGAFERMIGDYDGPRGNTAFIRSLASMLRSACGWKITERNIALTGGSQNAFLFLFNMFAGHARRGMRRRILLPLAPEYIGYADVGLNHDIFTAHRPEIDCFGDRTFKYRIAFDSLRVGDDAGALCVSRPTNPTGNVVTDDEVRRLARIARDRGIPLIIDNAYGLPFPGIIFTGATPYYDDNTIVCMSLSKFGLPTARTGIVVASEKIIGVLSNMNAVGGLAPGGIGPALAHDLVRSGDILRISREIIRPYYQRKALHTLACFNEALDGLDYRIHKPEGALFLWLWFKGLPITNAELYERLKRRGVLVVPGHYFFPGVRGAWRHKHECIRISYSPDDAIVEKGARIIAQEAKKAYAHK